MQPDFRGGETHRLKQPLGDVDWTQQWVDTTLSEEGEASPQTRFTMRDDHGLVVPVPMA